MRITRGQALWRLHKVVSSSTTSTHRPIQVILAFVSTLMGLFSFVVSHRGAVSLILCILLFFVVPILVSVVTFNRVMHVGHPTPFSPSDRRFGFTSGPNSRGTINIVWACLSTIFTCVHVSLHLDVPFSKGQSQGLREKIWSRMMTFMRKALWMIINIISPELIAFVAVIERLSARRGMKEMRRILGDHEGGDKKWTLAHAFFADMGGFKVRRLVVPSRSSSPETRAAERAGTGAEGEPTRSRSSESGENVAEQAQEPKPETPPLGNASAGAGVDIEAARMTDSKRVDVVVLRSGPDFYMWLRNNPEAAKSIDYEQVGLDIEDRIKADSVLKALTIVQVSWLVVQTITHAVKKQPVCELEVSTCAYVACTLITYTFWWHKPYGVQKHILLHVPFSHDPEDQDTRPTPLILNRDTENLDRLIATIASGCIGAAVGAIHCSMWNATFANSNGQLLWRISSIAQISSPMVMSLFLAWVALAVHYDFDSDWLGVCIVVCSLFSCFIQFCARIVLFILVGYSFWALPADIYIKTDWTWSWFPHVH